MRRSAWLLLPVMFVILLAIGVVPTTRAQRPASELPGRAKRDYSQRGRNATIRAGRAAGRNAAQRAATIGQRRVPDRWTPSRRTSSFANGGPISRRRRGPA